MPKQNKKIKCPRCGMAISKDNMAEHIRKHKKKSSPLRVPLNTRQLKLKPNNQTTEEREFWETLKKEMPVLSNISKEQLYSKFKNLLIKVDAKYSSFQVESMEKIGFIEVWIDQQRNITLKYNSIGLQTLPEEQIDALLLHEVCHVITLPDTTIVVPDTGDERMLAFFIDCAENYDEYLAHVELEKRFKSDRRYNNLRERQVILFENFEKITNTFKYISQSAIDEAYVFRQLQSIIYDSIFFYVVKDNSFLKWCFEHELNGLCVFINWLYEDFEYIRKLNLTRKKASEKVLTSGVLSSRVNPIKLLVLGQIEFYDTSEEFYKSMLEKGHDVDLIESWEKRRLSFTHLVI